MSELVLASTSAYRRELLARLGVPFRCRDPLVDERPYKGGSLAPRALAETLARAKAESLAAEEPEAVVIGGDQVVSFDGRTFGKPGDADGAARQLLAMAGRAHELITSAAVWRRGRTVVHTDVTTLWMRPLTRDEVSRYVAADRPHDCAGGYKIEGRGVALFSRIESADHTAITGLPLIAITSTLRELGFPIP